MVCTLVGYYAPSSDTTTTVGHGYSGYRKSVRVPLKKISVSSTLQDCLEQTVISQQYTNIEQQPLHELDYCFSLAEGSIITDLTTVFSSGRVLKGVFMEKVTATQTYDEAKTSGKKTQLLQKQRDGSYRILVGNLDVGETICVQLTYNNLLTASNSKLSYVFPTNIAPKYASFTDPQPSQQYYSDAVHFEFDVTIHLKTSGKLNSVHVSNPTSGASVTQTSDTAATITLSTWPSEGDVCVRFNEQHDFVPSVFNSTDGHHVYFGMKQTVPTVTLQPQNREFFILVDRSGSMENEKIAHAREAVKLLLNSLPVGSVFNIVSFGSSHKFMFSESTQYTNETKKLACKNVSTFQADMGGTELSAAFQQILTTPHAESTTERIIIIMTDGDISDKDTLVGLCSSVDSTTRVFGIGIGNDADRRTLATISDKTNGYSEMIVDNCISECIVNILQLVGLDRLSVNTVVASNVGLVELFTPSTRTKYYSGQEYIAFARFPVDVASQIGSLVFNFTSDSQGEVVIEVPAQQFSGSDERLAKFYANTVAEQTTDALLATSLSASLGVVNSHVSLVLVDQESNVEKSDVVATVPHYSRGYEESANESFSLGSRGYPQMASCSAPASRGFGAKKLVYKGSVGASLKNATYDIRAASFGTEECDNELSDEEEGDMGFGLYDDSAPTSPSQPSKQMFTDTIFDLQNVDGSFQLDHPRILTLLGKSEADLQTLLSTGLFTREQALYRLILEFLSTSTTYRLILEKTTSYLATIASANGTITGTSASA